MHAHRIILLTASVLAATALRGAAGGAAGPVVPDEVVRLMERRGVPFDEADLRRAAAGAMLKAVDARAELLDADGERWWSTNRSIACATQWPGDLAYVRMNGCFEADAGELGAVIRSVLSTNAQGLIVDLRGAGGASTGSMAAVGGLLLGEGVELARVRLATGETGGVIRTVGAVADPLPPVVLLTDGGTWGAAEGLAHGLKGRPRVLVLGAATAGDGAARERVGLGGGYTALVATGRYVGLDGLDVPAAGVHPDIEVAGPPVPRAVAADTAPAETNAASAQTLTKHPDGGDPVLRRAADLLLALRAMASTWDASSGDGEPGDGTDAPPEPAVDGEE